MHLSHRLRAHIDIVWGLVLLGLLGMCVATGSRKTVMTCWREPAVGVSCRTDTLTYSGRLRQEMIHARGEIRDMRLEKKSCGKSTGFGILVVDRVGHESTPFGCSDEARLRTAANELRRFMDDANAATVSVEPQRGSIVLVVIVCALAAFGLGLVVRGLRGVPSSPDSGALTGRPGRPTVQSRSSTGRSVGLVFGLLVVASAVSFVAARIMTRSASRTQGQLEVRCINTCRFEGARCLPGGRYSQWMAAGVYTMEVWAPDPAPRWQPLTFTIRVGELTRVDCVPR